MGCRSKEWHMRVCFFVAQKYEGGLKLNVAKSGWSRSSVLTNYLAPAFLAVMCMMLELGDAVWLALLAGALCTPAAAPARLRLMVSVATHGWVLPCVPMITSSLEGKEINWRFRVCLMVFASAKARTRFKFSCSTKLGEQNKNIEFDLTLLPKKLSNFI